MQEGLKARGNNTNQHQTGQMSSEPAAEPYQVAPPMEIPGMNPWVCEYLRTLFTLNHKLQKQLQEKMLMMQRMSAQMELLANRKKRARQGDNVSETPTKVTVQEHPAILQSLGYDNSALPTIPEPEPPWDRIPRIEIKPIPKNINPETNQGRRDKHKKCIGQTDSTTESTTIFYYADASDNYSTMSGNTAVGGPQTETTRSHTNNPSPTALEIQAIAEAIDSYAGKDPITI